MTKLVSGTESMKPRTAAAVPGNTSYGADWSYIWPRSSHQSASSVPSVLPASLLYTHLSDQVTCFYEPPSSVFIIKIEGNYTIQKYIL